MASEKSYVRDDNGSVTAVDYNYGDKTERYSVYEGTETPDNLIGVQDHKNGDFQECDGTDWLGNPVWK